MALNFTSILGSSDAQLANIILAFTEGNQVIDVAGQGIVSGESLGSPQLNLNIVLLNGVASAETFGNLTLNLNIDLDGAGITTGEQFGSHVIDVLFSVAPAGGIVLGGSAMVFTSAREIVPEGGIKIGGSAIVTVEAARCEVTVGSPPNTLPITKFRFPEAPLIPWEEPVFIECERDGELVCEEEISLRFVLPPLNLRNPLYRGRGAYLPAATVCHQELFKEFDVKVSVDQPVLSLLSFEEIGKPPVEEMVQIQIIEEPKSKVLKDKQRKAKKVTRLSNIAIPEPEEDDHYDPRMKMIFVRVMKGEQQEEIKPVIIKEKSKKLAVRKPKKAVSSKLLKNIEETKVVETEIPTLSSSERLAMTKFPEKVLEERKRRERPRIAAPVKATKTRGRKARNSLFQANVMQAEATRENRRGRARAVILP